MRIKVLDKTSWHFGSNNCGSGGMSGQLTKCLLEGRIVFYVRENLKGINTFLISSGERWGDKEGWSTPRPERQSLDLLAPVLHWHMIAEAVREADTLNRPVHKSRTFTWKWAEKEFAERLSLRNISDSSL